MISQLAVMMHIVGDRAYHLMCPPDAPISDLKEALAQFIKDAIEIEELARKKMKESEQQLFDGKKEELDVQSSV